jgi:hypothetical protein
VKCNPKSNSWNGVARRSPSVPPGVLFACRSANLQWSCIPKQETLQATVHLLREGSRCTRWYWWQGRAKVYYAAKNLMGFVGGTIICSRGALCSQARTRGRGRVITWRADRGWGWSWRGRVKTWVSGRRWCNYNLIEIEMLACDWARLVLVSMYLLVEWDWFWLCISWLSEIGFGFKDRNVRYKVNGATKYVGKHCVVHIFWIFLSIEKTQSDSFWTKFLSIIYWKCMSKRDSA